MPSIGPPSSWPLACHCRRRSYSHGWWTIEGEKISKSLGNGIDPRALVQAFGLDPLRFFLLREISFGSDGDFSQRALINRLNVELANDLGNLGSAGR